MVKQVNAGVQAGFGFSVFGYFLFFNEEDAASLLDRNVCTSPHSFGREEGRVYGNLTNLIASIS
jgi:hypothetical protein